MRIRVPDPNPQILVRFHFILMIAWVLATPITLKFPESVLWVAIMSQYALFVGHFSGWDASRAEANTPSMTDFRRLEKKVDRLLKGAG